MSKPMLLLWEQNWITAPTVRRHADEQLSMQRPAPLGPFASMEALVQSHVFWDGTPSQMGNSFLRSEHESTTKRR